MASSHQRVGALSNSHVGRDFEAFVEAYFQLTGGLTLRPGFSVPLGVGAIKRAHKFDLGSDNPSILIECKSLHWTEAGNIPSAKVLTCNEAMFYFLLAPSTYRMVLCMLQSVHPRRSETFAQYYARTYAHLIPPGVEIIEFDDERGTARTIKGIDVALPG